MNKLFKLGTYLKADFSQFERGSTFFVDNILFTVINVKPSTYNTVFSIQCETGDRIQIACVDFQPMLITANF